jgi:hypothetical protein
MALCIVAVLILCLGSALAQLEETPQEFQVLVNDIDPTTGSAGGNVR